MESAIQEAREVEAGISGGSVVPDGEEDPVDLVLVLQGDLYLIPFLMLRREQADRFLFEKYTTIIVPSISALSNSSNTSKSSGGSAVGSQASVASAGLVSPDSPAAGARTPGAKRQRPVVQSSGALVVGNPRLTPLICQHWRLQEIPGAEFEARILGELLTCRALIGAEATKGAVLHQIEQVEVVHFATHISWKLSSIVLSPGEMFLSSPPASQHHHHHHNHFSMLDSDGDSSSSDIAGPINGGGSGSGGGPALSEYLLTAADILNLKLRAKLVVLNSGYTDDRAGRVNTDGVVGLTRALLSAGAQCVLFSLWPVPDPASKLLMKTLYTALLDGVKVTKALSQAVRTVQTTAQFSHPSNWGGWVLVGADISLSSKSALMGHALGLILEAQGTCRQTLKVLLHLVEKSLQRIHQGCKNSMFTTQASIENKVGQVAGWKELLHAVGFRFEPSTGGLPPAVFFPQADPSDRLTQASASLQALLGLPTNSVSAMSKFVANFDVGESLIQVLREILSKLSAKESSIDVMVDVRMWDVPGCHEFLASLGLDLVAVGSDKVTLRLSKQAMRRYLQFALQALVSVFDTQEAPRTLHLDTSSSMESLSSTQSGPSSSTFSKSSATPPTSPMDRNVIGGGDFLRGGGAASLQSQKRSLFNPAEMERVRESHRNSLMAQGSLSGRHLSMDRGSSSRTSRSRSSASEQSTPSASPRSPCSPITPPAADSTAQSPPLDPAVQLSHQARIRHMYGGQSARSEGNPSEGGLNQDTSSIVDLEVPGNERGQERVGGDMDVAETLESEDDAVTLTNNSVSFTKRTDRKTAGTDNGHGDFIDGNVNTKEQFGHPSKISDTLVSNSKGQELVIDVKRAQARRSRGSSSSSSNTTNKTAEEQEEPVTPKSVTFAEQLISEEISFDPSVTHLGERNGDGVINTSVSPTNDQDSNSNFDVDNFDTWGRQQNENPAEIGKDDTNFRDLDRDKVPSGSNQSNQASINDNDSSGSGMTASQLRDHFEKMNSSGGQTRKPAPLPASRPSIAGRQPQQHQGAKIPSPSSSSPSPRVRGNNNISMNRPGMSTSKQPQKLNDDLSNPCTAEALVESEGPGSQPAENLAMRVLADVATQRAAVERMQMHSILQSQDAGRRLREEHHQQQQQQQKHPVPAQRQRRLSTSSQNSSLALSRDSPSSLSISSDINDSLVAPSGTPSYPGVTQDASGKASFSKGPHQQSIERSLPFEARNNPSDPVVSVPSRMVPAPRSHGSAPAHISHMSFHNSLEQNSLRPSQLSSSTTPVPTSTMNTTPHGAKEHFHSSQHQQQNTKASNRFGPSATARFSVQSAQSALFPQGGRPIPPASRPNSGISPGYAMHSSPVGQTRLSHKTIGVSEGGDGQHLGVGGSGENSISSDNSEGAESNLQSSASSGYHSEHSGLLRGIGMSSVISGSSGGGCARPVGGAQLTNEDRDLYTQEFVNRAPSFTYSSGSSSPYSRASNDEMAYPSGPDIGGTSNNKHGSYGMTSTNQRRLLDNRTNNLSDIAFPNQAAPKVSNVNLNSGMQKYPSFNNTNSLHNMLANEKQDRPSLQRAPSPSMRQSSSFGPGISSPGSYVPKSSFPLNKGHADEGSNSSLSSSSSSQLPSPSSSTLPLPPTPLVRTNALGPSPHSRPESSNSLSSQYSTSSSTLSTIYRPLQQQQQQQQHSVEQHGVDKRPTNTTGQIPTRGGQSPSPKAPTIGTSSHTGHKSYPGFPPKPQMMSSQSMGFQPNGHKEGAGTGTGNKDNLRQQQHIRPYRPISMSSHIGGPANNNRTGNLADLRQTSTTGANQYTTQGYKRNTQSPTDSYKPPSSNSFPGPKGFSKEHPNSTQHSMLPYQNNFSTDPKNVSQDSNSDSFTEDHDDYRARLADTQRNMFSKLQHPKLTHVTNTEGGQGQDRQRGSGYGYNPSSMGSNSSHFNSRPAHETKQGVAPPPSHQTANQMPPASSNQQSFQDPRGSVPVVLRSSKC